MILQSLKLCYQCKKEKPELKFSSDKTKSDGLQTSCKQCKKEYQKKYTQKNRDLIRNRQLEYKFGIFPGEIETRLKEQDGKCLICQQIMNSPQVDHNHQTNKVRGLLCINCNTNVGWFENNLILKYLNNPKWKFCLVWPCSRNQRDTTLRRRYNICLNDFEMMLRIQNGVCGICFKICSTGRNLCVDHDWKTLRVRGLLCMHCNGNLGWFDNNPILEYLNDSNN